MVRRVPFQSLIRAGPVRVMALVAALSALASAGRAFGAPRVTLVKDIYPGLFESAPMGLTRVGKTVFFRAHDPAHGSQLWKSDGTRAGTKLVRVIHRGSPRFGAELGDLTRASGMLFFVAYDGVHGYELWRSDGTRLGTRRLTRAPHRGPGNLANVGGTLFFSLSSRGPGNDAELWKSDGTRSGTKLVRPRLSNAAPGF